ncbi:MAG: TetR/AcrR family transcriptional regulator [Flavobacteriaceae bacterium]|nr:TetR/AcrR family transcriptional regulator [Flavobacteriaceae bacterium]
MKNTKERILDTALGLFNENGLSQVTLRSIAKKMEISQGNLNYHFKKREDIIETLYFNLVKHIDLKMSNNKEEEVSLKLLLNLSTSIMSDFYEYRFFLLDFVQIMRENKIIKTHYLELSKIRESQFLGLFAVLIKKGIMRKEILHNEYAFLYRRFQILGDFWISSAQLTHKHISKEMIKEYADIINQSIYPYLTEKGKVAYLNV